MPRLHDDRPLAPRRAAWRPAWWSTLPAGGRGVLLAATLVATAWLLGWVAAAPCQRLIAPLPERLLVRRVQTRRGPSGYATLVAAGATPLRGYRVAELLPENVLVPFAGPSDPPYETLFLVPTSTLFDCTHDFRSWWDLRGGAWSYRRAGTSTAADGTSWTVFERVRR